MIFFSFAYKSWDAIIIRSRTNIVQGTVSTSVIIAFYLRKTYNAGHDALQMKNYRSLNLFSTPVRHENPEAITPRK